MGTKTPKPYQGLKHIRTVLSLNPRSGTKTPKPYQGLKRPLLKDAPPLRVTIGTKTPKPYQGLKLLDRIEDCPRQGTKTPKPYQGLKLLN